MWVQPPKPPKPLKGERKFKTMNDNIQKIKNTTVNPPPLGGRGASVSVFAPATVANVVCGFDVLGFAVNQPGDEVVMRVMNKPGIAISKITGDDGRLPLDPAKNKIGRASCRERV